MKQNIIIYNKYSEHSVKVMKKKVEKLKLNKTVVMKIKNTC